MPDIFISYRRDDSAATCGRIYDHLAAFFGEKAVFRDVNDIPYGVDFRGYIRSIMAQCAIELVLIGARWLDVKNRQGVRRLDVPDDPVRTEIEIAFELGIRVIPLLVDQADMPTLDRLPRSIRSLADLNAAPVRYDPDFKTDMQRVITGLEVIIRSTPLEQRPISRNQRSPRAPDDFGNASRPWQDIVEVRIGQATEGHSPDQIQVTAYYPLDASAASSHMMLVYVHSSQDLADVRADAQTFRSELGSNFRSRWFPRDDTPLPRGATSVSVVPSCAGVRFDPDHVTLERDGTWRRSMFHFRPDHGLRGEAATIGLDIHAGPLLFCSARMPVIFSAFGQSLTGANIYQKVFASYSHDDTVVVRAVQAAFEALGIQLLRDAATLRSGEHWESRLKEMIESADVFQLFWSARAAASDYVRREWEYALSLDRGPGFIRPVYWEKPLAPPPPELAHLQFAYVLIPQLSDEGEGATEIGIAEPSGRSGLLSRLIRHRSK